MNGAYVRFLLTRLFWFLVILGGFCALPGPRSVLQKLVGYLLAPTSVESMWAGLHLSLIHVCWLLGFDLQLLPYPQGVDPQLAAIAFLASIVVQAVLLFLIVFLLRGSLRHYDDDGDEAEE